MGFNEYLNRTGNQGRWKLCALFAVVLHVAAFAGSSLVMAHQAEYGMAGAVAGGGIPRVIQPPEEQTVELESDGNDAPTEKRQPKPKPTPVKPTGIGGAASGGALELAAYYRNPPPPYPDAARRFKEEGVVLLHVEVDPQGHASNVSLVQSCGYSDLDESALDTVKSWRFKPATVAGIAISTSVNVPVRFRLKDIR
jgi:protein TonB